MTRKFGRTYRITIDPKDGGNLIVITLPLTVKFWVQRNTYSDLNNLTLDIYNLSETNRNRIFQDRFDIGVPVPTPSAPTALPAANSPLGIRNNNPGNLQPGGKETAFQTLQDGINAELNQLGLYAGRGITNLAGVASLWPDQANATTWLQTVVQYSGFAANQPIDLTNSAIQAKVANAINIAENGTAGANLGSLGSTNNAPSVIPPTYVGREITFEVGYSTLYQVYKGTIFQASSAREGTNIVTRISAMTGNFDVATTQTFQTIDGNQTLGQVFQALIGEFPNLTLGGMGEFSLTRPRPWVINGNVYNWIKQHSSQNVFIDNGKVYILRPAEAISDNIVTIDDSTGLLETPRRDEGFLSVTTLLEPGVNIVGSQITLNSTVQKVYNGQYKVAGIQHQGVISAAMCGEARSVFTLVAAGFFKQGLVGVSSQ